jgi:CPA2 family monovalent cation:H+ antiporter-2
MDHLIVQAAVYLGAAVLAVPLAARLGLGSVLGFLGAGIVIGPVLGLVGRESQALRDFGEYGIAIMLFLVGLEVSPRALWSLRRKLVGLGGLQIGLTAAWFLAASLAIGHDWSAAVAIGLILSLSSTAIVVQTLSEKGLLDTPGGRSGFAVLLAQDIAVIPMLAVLPLLASDATPEGGAHGLSLVDGLPAWAVALLTLGAVAAVVLTGIFLTRPVFRWIGQARLREIDTALALFVVVSIILLMEMVGLSPALGTFLAGVVLAGSEFRHELESDLEPFKGLLLGLFFIGVGAGIDSDRLLTNPMGFLALTIGLIGAKALILFLLANLFGLRGRDRWVLTLGLAQGGEFGFVLVAYALSLGVLTDGLGQQLLLVIALSMLATPLLFLSVDRFLPASAPGTERPPEPIDQAHPVIVAGMGRFGRTVHRLLRTAGQEAVLLDTDMDAIEQMRSQGHRVFLGDPTRPEVLHLAGLETARVLVAALDDGPATTRLVALARKRRPDLHIIARALDRTHGHALIHAGADEVLGEVFDSSLRAGRHVLEALGWDPGDLAEAERLFARLEREALRELAQLWRPDLPDHQNEPYRARSRQLTEEIERALSERLARRPGA